MGRRRDWIHSLLVDDEGHGVAWANGQLRRFDPIGDYVWVLDDDDECILPDMLNLLEDVVYKHLPDAVVVRMDHGPPLGILPDDICWGRYLYLGGVGCSALISSKETWLAHRESWGYHYAGDYDYVDAVQCSDAVFYWWDVVASRANGRNMGAPLNGGD